MRNEKGSSLAEMAILLPIYVILMTGAIYFAHIGLAKIGVQKSVGYAAAQIGQQGLSDVDDLMSVGSWITNISFNDDVADGEEMWSGDDIDAVLEDMARAPVGHYEIKDGEIIYVLDEDRMSEYGEYIFANNLQEESDNVAEVLDSWLYRSRSTMSCNYEPVFGDWDVVDIKNMSSSSYVSGDQDRGTHPLDSPDFNREIVGMLSNTAFPGTISPEPDLWLPQSR